MSNQISRRSFLHGACTAIGAASFPALSAASAKSREIAFNNLPIWRGFNLLEKFTAENAAPYQERDFETIASWRFNFVRLPLDYRCWTPEPRSINDTELRQIDQAIEWARQRRIHTNLCLHRAPGYCINERQPGTQRLWQEGSAGEEARRQFTAQWLMFAQRYAHYSNESVSFNLLNEPGDDTTEPIYRRAIEPAIAAIRSVSPNRLIFVDGLRLGQIPILDFSSLKVAQSQHCYAPLRLTHYQASWTPGSSTWSKPNWPMEVEGELWNAEKLRQKEVLPWSALKSKGIGIHVSEFGVYNKTPHPVALKWMKDQLTMWRQAGWGWALWNLRGEFGVLDSQRADVHYERFGPHLLDRKMYELIIS